MVKRENVQKMDPKFRVFHDAEIVVSPQCHTIFYKNMWFYEHGFRSGGMFMLEKTMNVPVFVRVYLWVSEG